MKLKLHGLGFGQPVKHGEEGSSVSGIPFSTFTALMGKP
jgi:hypothetical protein